MAHGTEPTPSPVPQPSGAPASDLVVFAGDNGWRVAVPLNRVVDGVDVIAVGTVDNISEHGSIDAPTATFHLVSGDGPAAYAYVSAETLTAFSLYLLNGLDVSVHGIAMRACDGAAAYIHVTRVEFLHR